MANHAIGVDIGGTGIKGARVDLVSGQLAGERVRIATPQPATPDAVVEVVNQVIERVGGHGPVGLTLPAVIRGNIVRTAANIDPGWIGVNAVDFQHLSSGGQPPREIRFGRAQAGLLPIQNADDLSVVAEDGVG